MINVSGLQLLTRQYYWGLVMVLTIIPLSSQATGLLILSSRTGEAYADTIEGIKTELGRSLELRVQYLNDPLLAWREADSPSLVITVGVDAANAAIQGVEPSTPVLCLLIPKITFESLTVNKREGRKISAIYLDTPVNRQIELIRILLPQARSVGALLGERSVREKEALKAAVRERGLTLRSDYARRESEVYPILKSILSESDVFLAVPDPLVMNASTAQNVLITAFRSQVPVVGYSASYVKAGALAAVYSTPKQIGQEAGQIAKTYQRTNILPAPKHPRYFSVGVNAGLMKTIGMPFVDEQLLEQRLLKGE
jgi:ABC-type uncharacterized transport system substrate-binding protein